MKIRPCQTKTYQLHGNKNRHFHGFTIPLQWLTPKMPGNFGLVEGRDVVIELRYAQGGLQQLPELAAELVRLKVDVIEASGDLAPRVAQQATTTIPIVAFSDDILGAGLITSLSRPGGNTTGLTILSPELSAKRLEVLRLESSSRESREWLRCGIPRPAHPK